MTSRFWTASGNGLWNGFPSGAATFDVLTTTPLAWYDPSDLSSMFQDAAGTIAVAANNDPVRRINDKSGNGYNAIAANDSSRPLYQTGGFLLFDGVDDGLQALFTLNQPFERVSAIQQVSWTSGDQIFGGGSANAGCAFLNGSTPNLDLFDGAVACSNAGATVGANHVLTERHDNANSRLAVDNGAYSTGTTSTNISGGITLGNSNSLANAANIRFYGAVLKGVFTDPEIASLRTYLGAKAGLTL